MGNSNLKQVNSEKINEDNLHNFFPRNILKIDEIKNKVQAIIDDVKLNGDKAIIKYTEKFDKVKIDIHEIKVTQEEIQTAYTLIEQNLLDAIQFSKKNLITFHEAQMNKEWAIDILEGVNAGQIHRPIESVGIYVPGGRAIYPSTVLMAAAPAFVAGVEEILICSPPQKNGNIAPEILVAANEFNIKTIFKIGGVQAIAAMAYGTASVPKVLKVVGPGNKWVNAAKQLLSNIVGIDNPAGPSEILIIADDSANYKNVIVDFISQIEHDPDNLGIIASNSKELIHKIKENLNRFIEDTPRKKIIRKALNNCLIIFCETLKESTRICNLIAPEHLEILTRSPRALLPDIKNAGAIFLGNNTPVPLGDYSAGTNHILPTCSYAKTYSGLNIYDFIKLIDVLECSKEGLKRISKSAMILAEFEKLYAHKQAIKQRLEKIETKEDNS
jgi:histidinol dehydrogenase